MSLSQEIDVIVKGRHLLDHPFYVAWSEGRLSTEALRGYAAQYYQHVVSFPTYLSATHAETTDIKTRQYLLENLNDEEAGDDNHPELWLRFCEGLGLTREDVRAAAPLPETSACDATYRDLARRGTTAGLAALYAYESMVPPVAETKIEGLARHYGISDDRTIAFFQVHLSIDEWHAEVARDLLNSTVPADEHALALRSAEEATKALYTLLDGVVRAYCPEVAA